MVNSVLLGLLGLAIAGVAAFFLIGPQRVWVAAYGPADLGPQDRTALERTGKPNDALFVSEGAHPVADAFTAPTFAVDAEILFSTLLERITQSERVTWVHKDSGEHYARAVTTSPLMRFPDTNHIWVVENEAGTSSLFLYAAAQIGHSDLGKNKERLERWIALLDDLPRPTPPASP